MEYYSSEGEAFKFCRSSLAEEQNFTNIYQEKLTIKQISKVALPLDKRNTNAAALLILFSQLADFRRAAQRNGYCS